MPASLVPSKGPLPIDGHLLAASSYSGERVSVGLSSSPNEDTNDVMETPPSRLHLTLIISQRLQIPSCWGLGLQHMNSWGAHIIITYAKCVLAKRLSVKSLLVILKFKIPIIYRMSGLQEYSCDIECLFITT